MQMEECVQFAMREVVWGKVGEYPWWPARVVKRVSEPGSRIYKLHFFGDPTYCYLEGRCVLPFSDGLRRAQTSPSQFKLEKPLQLATAALEKSAHRPNKPTQSIPCAQSETLPLVEQPPSPVPASKNIQLSPPPSSVPSPTNQQEQTLCRGVWEQMSMEKVQDMLRSSSFRCWQLLKGYNNRKQFRFMKQTLKSRILNKYNLQHIPLPKKRKLLTKAPKKAPARSGVQGKCARKLHLIMKKKWKDLNVNESCSGMMDKLSQVGVNTKEYRQIFKSMLACVKSNHFLEEAKKQDDQKSKTTYFE